jgi:hypothetical protein
MPYLFDYITELEIGDDKDLEKVFNFALSQVFDSKYLSKIEDTLKNKIKIKEKVSRNPDIVAWVEGTTIYVNRPEFLARDMKSRIRYILHEFMHILNNSKSFIFANKFKEINELSKELWEIVKTHTKNPGKFLTGRNVDKNLLNDQEALSYLMNDKIQWKEITPEGRKLFISTLKKYGVFNLEHEFWRKRLS